MDTRKNLGKWRVAAIACLAAAAFPTGLQADYVIVDDNSQVTVNTSTGMYTWLVDDVDHLYSQWFWYRIGDTGGETDVGELTLDVAGTSDTNFDGEDETLFIRYLAADFNVELTFLLTGGAPGSGMSDIGESIKIINTSLTAELDFHFFQYCDLDLNQTIQDDLAEIVGGNTAIQTEAPVTVSETVETPYASHYEVSTYPTTLLSLEDGNPTTLNDFAGPLGPADLTWAFQWDFALPAGDSYLISKDKLIIPEPATIGLLALGGMSLIRRRRR
jgi:hypothetical protein